MGWNVMNHILDSNSSGTGTPHFVGDARLLTLSIVTSTGSASRFTIELSNADGFTAAIPDTSWSVATVLLNSGIYTIDPDGRWLRASQPNFALSSASSVLMRLNKYYESC